MIVSPEASRKPVVAVTPAMPTRMLAAPVFWMISALRFAFAAMI
jgi:hypothetical protein